jgi:hypothetical protein
VSRIRSLPNPPKYIETMDSVNTWVEATNLPPMVKQEIAKGLSQLSAENSVMFMDVYNNLGTVDQYLSDSEPPPSRDRDHLP